MSCVVSKIGGSHIRKPLAAPPARLNKKLYDSVHFVSRGIDHVEMYFDDGTNPTLEMCRRFIDLSDRVISEGGAVAVHCKAGLGRTGTLIGAYLIYKHGFTADEGECERAFVLSRSIKRV